MNFNKKNNINSIEKKFLNYYSIIKKFKTTRRDFLKWIGFSTAIATLASCKGPIIKSIPYVVKPDSITPGLPNYYASTFFDGFDLNSVLVKTREGRPIKIQPNTISKYFSTLSVRTQASILSLYDNDRLKGPYIKKNKSTWLEVDKYVLNILKKIKKKKIIILSSSLPSPSTKKLIFDFSKKYPNTKNIIYDSISYSNVLDATKEVFGIRAIPFYDLSKCELIISFNADFLGDWNTDNIKIDYVKIRNPQKYMMHHIQIESNMTISGANADIRIPLKPSKINKLLVKLYNSLFKKKIYKNEIIKNLVEKIKKKGKKSVILADGDKESYVLALLINKKIKSLSICKDKFFLNKENNNKDIENLIKDIKNEKIGALFIYNTNPVYSFPYLEKLKNKLQKIDLTVSFSMKEDETSSFMKVWAPIPHWLESWGDTHPITGMYTIMQPTIQNLFDTRQFQDSLLIWKKNKNKNYYNYLKFFWEKNILPKSNKKSFKEALYYGFVKIKEKIFFKKNKKKINIENYLAFLSKKNYKKGFELQLYIKNSIGDGTQSNNPWLQEFPDPITRNTWGNYITMSPFDAKKLNIKNWYTGNGSIMNGNCVNLILEKINIKNIPIYIQPGQAIGSIGLSFGYGKKKGKIVNEVDGVNAFFIYKNFNFTQNGVIIYKTKKNHKFSCIQLQNTLLGRKNIAREVDLQTFLKKKKKIWNKEEKINTYKGKLSFDNISLWKEYDSYHGHHFNLSIDLNSCIGCGSCVLSCQVENNIPVVGKKEIRNSRDMHWIRIDRYYSSERKFEKISEQNPFFEQKIYNHLIKPEKYNPKVIFQPILCQHCNNAPCETVCPVGATTHGIQGQNMMAYNRCIGTRYCANNCPYKVRRFNWFKYSQNKDFDYNMNNEIGRMVLNPDVVVRSRGVMEKCSMCIQMTQSTILKAKKENRIVKDEEFQTACSQSCPTKAITFGDINDKKSEIYKKLKSKKSYKLLDFIGTKPNVFYQIKIRNI
jgi:Fe-S-cluster-containing dehydrogenase component